MPHRHLRYTFVSGFLLKLIENKHYDIVWGWHRKIVFSRHYDETKSNHNFNIWRHKPRGWDLEGLSACPSGWEPCDLYGNKYCRARSPPGRLTQMLFHSWGARCQLHLESVCVGLFKSVNTYFEKAINISQGSRVTLPPLLWALAKKEELWAANTISSVCILPLGDRKEVWPWVTTIFVGREEPLAATVHFLLGNNWSQLKGLLVTCLWTQVSHWDKSLTSSKLHQRALPAAVWEWEWCGQ